MFKKKKKIEEKINSFFDFEKDKIDKSDKDRLIYIQQSAEALKKLYSTDDKVNELITWLWCKAFELPFYERKIIGKWKKSKTIKVSENVYKKNVHYGDLQIFCVISLMYEYNNRQKGDVLDRIIYDIYSRLDEIIHPYNDTDNDIDIDYYSEMAIRQRKK